MTATKMRVPLSDIVPSGSNPRHDFGDIAALAETIRATGGEPVNPPVLVRDGNVYRIVDGERRYRAMVQIYGEGSGREVEAIVHDDLEEANELVAMIATDDKLALTEAEVARGVQQMLLLGVDTERTASAARTSRGKVAAMRMMAGRAPEGVQLTLDQALAASQLDDEYADRVLAAGNGWRYEESRIKREISTARKVGKIAEALVKAGVEVVDDAPEGMAKLATVYEYEATPAKVGEVAEALACDLCATVGPTGTVTFYGPEGAASAEDQRDSIARRARADSRDLYDRIAEWVLCGGMEPSQELNDAVIEDRAFSLRYGTDEAIGRLEELADKRAAQLRQVSTFEAEKRLITIAWNDIDGVDVLRGSYEKDDGPLVRRCREFLDAMDLAAACGFEAAERDQWLLSTCREVVEDLGGPDA